MRLSLFIASSLLAAPAFAADLGTYRPGTPYHSVIVPTANVCESQCAGDARCQSWNYVKASPNAPGVCEFQSDAGPAISSAISISGVSATARPTSDRLIAGGTNTIRVGTSVAQTPAPNITQQGQRRVVRHALPQGQRFQPALGGFGPEVGVAPNQAPQIRPQTQPATSRGPARQPYAQRQVAPMNAPMVSMHGQVSQPHIASSGRPPIGQPIAAPQARMVPARTPPRPSTQMNMSQSNMPRSSAQAPVTWQNAQQFIPVTQNTAPLSPQAPVIAAPQSSASAQPQQNLYGRLNDDVTGSAAGGAGQFPTVQSRPTIPVTQSSLAGAPPR